MSQGFAYSVKRWFYTTNHKDIGILYIITSLFLFAAAGVLAITMRTQLSIPDNTILTANVYNQFVTVHGLLMIFWVLSPFFFQAEDGIRDLTVTGVQTCALPI